MAAPLEGQGKSFGLKDAEASLPLEWSRKAEAGLHSVYAATATPKGCPTPWLMTAWTHTGHFKTQHLQVPLPKIARWRNSTRCLIHEQFCTGEKSWGGSLGKRDRDQLCRQPLDTHH